MVSARHVYERRIPSSNGHLIRFDLDEIKQWLNSNRCPVGDNHRPHGYRRRSDHSRVAGRLESSLPILRRDRCVLIRSVAATSRLSWVSAPPNPLPIVAVPEEKSRTTVRVMV